MARASAAASWRHRSTAGGSWAASAPRRGVAGPRVALVKPCSLEVAFSSASARRSLGLLRRRRTGRSQMYCPSLCSHFLSSSGLVKETGVKRDRRANASVLKDTSMPARSKAGAAKTPSFGTPTDEPERFRLLWTLRTTGLQGRAAQELSGKLPRWALSQPFWRARTRSTQRQHEEAAPTPRAGVGRSRLPPGLPTRQRRAGTRAPGAF